MQTIDEIDQLLKIAEKELAQLDQERSTILERIRNLHLEKERSKPILSVSSSDRNTPIVTNHSSQDEKIHLFRSLFKGREDVYPRRFESFKTGKAGYQPVCRNEWIVNICKKPKISCSNCENREFLPVTNEVIRNHLLGFNPDESSKRDFTIGVYPLLLDETCWFLALDFDKSSWMEDVSAFSKTCKSYDVPFALERSRSGKGGHIWIFFIESIPASLARKLGSFLLTETMEKRPEIGFESYDRFFPSQDTLPKGGFGNLIALPLQKKLREKGNTVFIDENFLPYSDQWEFLNSINRMNPDKVEQIVKNALLRGRVSNVKEIDYADIVVEPWTLPPSKKKKELQIIGPLPEQVKLTLNNQIYIDKNELTPFLQNQLIHITAFQNPEFYKAQAMRLPTYNKPQIISCFEDFQNYLGIPRGCLDEVIDLLNSFDIKTTIIDKRFTGTEICVSFNGVLRPEQQAAAESMLYYDTGILSAATSFGKTIVAIYMIAKRNVNTLILVHRRQLLDQWIARLTNFLEIDPKEIGQIGAGKRNPLGKIDVAIIQSLSKNGIVDDVVGGYGHLIIDECHHISARSFEIVARQCKAKYVMGLSATVTRLDGHHPIIFMNIGQVRYTVSDKKQAAARPFKHKVIVRKTEFSYNGILNNEKSQSIHELYTALVRDKNRNTMIIDDIIKSVIEKRSPIVLTERKEHLDYLSDSLSHAVRNVFVLKGGMGKKQRLLLYNKMQELPDDEERLIIATGKYLGEGFDDSRLDTLFMTLPISWKGTLAQYAGRLHRLHDMKKDVVIYDYADLNIPVLAKMYDRRQRGYKSIGYEVISD